MPQRPMSPQLQAAQDLFFRPSDEPSDGVFRPAYSDLERQIFAQQARWPGAVGLGLTELVDLAGQRSNERGQPNRTPSADHLAHLDSLYGPNSASTPGVNPGTPGTGNIAREANSSFGNQAFDPSSSISDQRDGVFGPLAKNVPPRRFTGSQNLQTFLSRVR